VLWEKMRLLLSLSSLLAVDTRELICQVLCGSPSPHSCTVERLDVEQRRVDNLTGVVAQLEARMQELAALAAEAPAGNSLEVCNGPAAELFVAANAIRGQWLEAQAALSTSRNLVAMLEQEYRESRKHDVIWRPKPVIHAHSTLSPKRASAAVGPHQGNSRLLFGKLKHWCMLLSLSLMAAGVCVDS